MCWKVMHTVEKEKGEAVVIVSIKMEALELFYMFLIWKGRATSDPYLTDGAFESAKKTL